VKDPAGGGQVAEEPLLSGRWKDPLKLPVMGMTVFMEFGIGKFVVCLRPLTISVQENPNMSH
jgi:hypothetical protein